MLQRPDTPPTKRRTRGYFSRSRRHIVMEMAIAAGIPVPPVYVMDGESGINAFAAGYEPTHAVIGVTRGAIEQLDRDELQGVIAHEFSHILNGDMRLNIQLIGILHGLLLIGIIGRVLIHSGGGRRGGKNNGNQIALVGLALMLIGYLGTLCGSIIKAAVSRQREYLADSSAVQFTRDASGLAAALKKVVTDSVNEFLRPIRARGRRESPEPWPTG